MTDFIINLRPKLMTGLVASKPLVTPSLTYAEFLETRILYQLRTSYNPDACMIDIIGTTELNARIL